MPTIAAAALALAACHQSTPADARAAHERLRMTVNDRLQAIYSTVAPCDEAGGAITRAFESGDRQALYEAATDGRSVCRDASTTLSGLKPPMGMAEKASGSFATAFSDLGTAVFARADAFETLAKAADAGDVRPSAVADMKQSMQLYRDGLASGLAKYLAAASTAGIKPEELTIKPTA